MRYSRTSNYLERVLLYNLTHMMSIVDCVAIGEETLKIDSGCSLEKEFIELIRMNPGILIMCNCQHVNSCHACVCGLLT